MAARLIQLELVNFKSYHGPTVIGPFHDFSCIVGPNGAGKSNLMDSLSFVIGSSSAQLRGAKLTDLINKRAKKQECRVTMVMRLASGSTLRLARSVGAKGDVQTFVDDHPVPEKDFKLVLRKHKIAARALNTFLVFQHEVDALANKKPKELTELLEVVSGSSELKAEYDEKRKALEDANEILGQAADDKRGAVAEVNQMRLHKKEAEKFTETNDRIIADRKDLALTELFHIENDLRKKKEELAAHQGEVSERESTVITEGDAKALKKEYAAQHKAYLELLKKGRERATELRDKKGTLERIRAAATHLERRLERETHDLKMASDKSNIRSKETARLEEEVKKQVTLQTAFEEQCKKEDAEAAKTTKLTPEHMTEYRRLRKDADCESITVRQQLETVRRQRDSTNEALKQANVSLENQETTKKEVVETIARNEERARENEHRIAELADKEKDLGLQVEGARANLHQLQAKRTERDEELNRLQAQLHDLRHTKDENRTAERFNEALSSLKSMFSGVRGRLVDLCTIPNQRYRFAVTVAMGKNLEAVVVDTTETALACVKYLKEQRAVAMNFIPLASAQGTHVDDRLRTFGGSCKPVIDVVKCDPSLEPAVRYALGQTLVCDGTDEAKRIAFFNPDGRRYKVVTLEGSMLLKNGSIQGGLSTVQSRARKWDENAYYSVKAAREKLLSDAGGSSEAMEAKALCEAKECQQRLEFTVKRVAELQKEQKVLAEKNKALAGEKKKQEDQITSLKKRVATYTTELNKLEDEMLELQKSVLAIDQKIFASFQKKVGIPNIAELEQKETRQARTRADKRQQFAVLIHKLKTSIEAEIKRVGAKDPKDLEKIVQQTKAEIKTCTTDLATYQKVVESEVKKHETTQKDLQDAKAKLDTLEKNIKQSGKKADTELSALQHAKKAASTIHAACESLRFQRLALFQRCRMEQIDLPTVQGADKTGEGSGKRGRGSNDDQETGLKVRMSEAFTSFASQSDGAAGKRSKRDEAIISIDFSTLPERLRRIAMDRARFREYKHETETTLDQMERELDALAPNLKATSRFASSEKKLGNVTNQLEDKREAARRALAEFTKIKDQRVRRFMDCFDRILENVDVSYRELTESTRAQGVHGSAYITLDDADEPYNGGAKYHATPPMKRFMPMDALSGGERTMAALALLFAIHNTSPAPFFVLDEVDAALDIGNAVALSRYLKNHSATCQFLVVSLKDQVYHNADSLIGVFKDRARESSGTLTLDLRSVPV